VKALRADPDASSSSISIPASPEQESVPVEGPSRISPEDVDPVDVFSLRGEAGQTQSIFTQKICEGGASDVSVMRLSYGQDEEEHVHRGQDHVLVLMEGRGEVHLGDRVIEVMTGSTLLVPRGVPHQIKNTSSSDLVVLEIGNG
jgi:mannose-6-phosphate isomerase-like protein (cupin superfamily)